MIDKDIKRLQLPDPSGVSFDPDNRKVTGVVNLFRATVRVLRQNRKLHQLSEQDVWCGNAFILSLIADADFVRFVHKVTHIDLRYEVDDDELRYMYEENELIVFGVRRN